MCGGIRKRLLLKEVRYVNRRSTSLVARCTLQGLNADQKNIRRENDANHNVTLQIRRVSAARMGAAPNTGQRARHRPTQHVARWEMHVPMYHCRSEQYPQREWERHLARAKVPIRLPNMRRALLAASGARSASDNAGRFAVPGPSKAFASVLVSSAGRAWPRVQE